VEVKRKLATAINRFLEPMRERRAAYEGKPHLVDEIIHDGTTRYRDGQAAETLHMVRAAMGLMND
jgi:tryptophanyl-tRNA synthetase